MDITFSTLQQLSRRISCRCECSKEAYQTLCDLKPENMQPHQYAFVLYLRGTHLFNQWKVSGELAQLEAAEECFDAIFQHMKAPDIRNPRYFFKRAHTKYTIAGAITQPGDQLMLLDQAESINNEGMNRFPENASMKWLAPEIRKAHPNS